MKYDILLNVLDAVRSEAPARHSSRYSSSEGDTEKINAARSRAMIHLFFKVEFGMLDFEERERQITDGSQDGGIDGYHIYDETKTIYLIQSKFRTTKKNFENKDITLKEVLMMDVNRILEGEQADEQGIPYNGKIKQLQREVASIPDVARYSYRVILLANLSNVSPTKLRQLTGGYAVEVFDFEKVYTHLVFPVLAGVYFTAADISIPIDLSNKNAGSKISYTVKTKVSSCEITVLFVPTIEIAKIMGKFKNTVLKYNPRSYLDLEGQSVNNSIRATILNSNTNEFALYNNGITILSDETYINERIGQKNKAQLRIKNPQIINGGQTSYTLSRIFDETPPEERERLFDDKEVLLKVITLVDNSNYPDKLRLIDEISNATNKQTPVINADRFANESFHQKIQQKMFDRYGFLYERKRGEFSDGLRSQYVDSSIIIERNLFLRVFYAANGDINTGVRKKLFQRNSFPGVDLDNDSSFDRFFIGFHVFRRLAQNRSPSQRLEKDIYGKVFAYAEMFLPEGLASDEETLSRNVAKLEEKWREFVKQKEESADARYKYFDKSTGEYVFSSRRYYRTGGFAHDVVTYFRNGASGRSREPSS